MLLLKSMQLIILEVKIKGEKRNN